MGALHNLDWVAVEILIAFYCLVQWLIVKGFVCFTSRDSNNQLCNSFSGLYSVFCWILNFSSLTVFFVALGFAAGIIKFTSKPKKQEKWERLNSWRKITFREMLQKVQRSVKIQWKSYLFTSRWQFEGVQQVNTWKRMEANLNPFAGRVICLKVVTDIQKSARSLPYFSGTWRHKPQSPSRIKVGWAFSQVNCLSSGKQEVQKLEKKKDSIWL